MHTAGRRVVAALWSLQGIGLKTIAQVATAGPPEELLGLDRHALSKRLGLTPRARAAIERVGTLEAAAQRLEGQLQTLQYQLAFVGDPAYPPLLAQVSTAPPLLFHAGPGATAPSRRRLAVVGTRHPDSGYAQRTAAFCRQLAGEGIGIISGAAEGIDQAAHQGALAAEGETWSFLGSAIEEVDAAQRPVVEALREAGGTVFSEFPPGARPDRSTFPRRNRLISGAADAVLVVRAGTDSGALHTARYALEQGRPLLAMPGDFFNAAARGCNELLRQGQARVCLSADDVRRALGLDDVIGRPVARHEAVAVSAEAARVLEVLGREALDFDAIAAQLPSQISDGLTAHLIELQLAGAVVQKPGSRYEKL